MPSWTDPGADRSRAGWGDAVRDLGHLVRFRASTVRRPWLAASAGVLVAALTVVFAVSPADSERLHDGIAGEVVVQLTDMLSGKLGWAFAAFLLLGISASMGGGGGRELLSRSEASIHPVSPLTEHLAALALMPLNVAWLVQAWGLFAVTALVVSDGRVAGAQMVVVAWILAATTVGQALGWAVEGVRRTTHGVALVRTALAFVALGIGTLHLTDRLSSTLTALPTTTLTEVMVTDRWPVAAAGLLAVAAFALWVGAFPARWALGLPPREELKVASGVHEARPVPEPRWGDPDSALLRRLDRGSVWRSVGMRRGLLILGTGPGLVALVMGLTWGSVMMLPGLAASGAALLFGVNAWCLDGKGMVWRETLPVAASRVFDARAAVIAECLVVVSGITVALALVRNGVPPVQVGLSVASCWVVVVVQVLATSMWWSVKSPFSVDLSSPRATPAPHAMMAGYAARLSLVTTLTGLVFAACAQLSYWWLPLVVAAAFLVKSGLRLRRARRRWLDPVARARIDLTVAAV